MGNHVIDEPIIISGGSVKITTQRKLKEAPASGWGESYEYPGDAQLKSIQIDGGTPISIKKDSKIVILCEVSKP